MWAKRRSRRCLWTSRSFWENDHSCAESRSVVLVRVEVEFLGAGGVENCGPEEVEAGGGVWGVGAEALAEPRMMCEGLGGGGRWDLA